MPGSPKKLPPSRAMALEVLRLVLDEPVHRAVDVQPALDRVISSRQPSASDVGLATELAYGYLRLKSRLETIVNSFLRTPEKTPAGLVRILCVAAYELLFLDRVPAYASLDWAVSRASKRYGTVLGKVTNGVLRNIDRSSDEMSSIEWFKRHLAHEQDALAVFYASPPWMVRLWTDAYGDDKALKFLEASIKPAPVGLRVNRQRKGADRLCEELDQALGSEKLARDGYSFCFAPGALDRNQLRELVESGRVTRQSYASQQVLTALEPESWPGPVWDACCGRGGKTTHLLERGVDVTVASDVNQMRLGGLAHELQRLGLIAPTLLLASAAAPAPMQQAPGTILLDAPCSGLGVLSRRPEAKWRRTPRDLGDLQDLQQRMLQSAFEAVAPGGLVVYVTCTLNPAENNAVVQWLCEQSPGAELLTEYETPVQAGGFPCEFFYGATLRKPR